MVHSLAQSLSLDFNRIQFTPDLMPSDITGTEVLYEDRNSGSANCGCTGSGRPRFGSVHLRRSPRGCGRAGLIPRPGLALSDLLKDRQILGSDLDRTWFSATHGASS